MISLALKALDVIHASLPKASLQVRRDHVALRIRASRKSHKVLLSEVVAAFDSGAVPVASVEYFALVQYNRHADAIGADILDQRGEIVALDQREHISERMWHECPDPDGELGLGHNCVIHVVAPCWDVLVRTRRAIHASRSAGR